MFMNVWGKPGIHGRRPCNSPVLVEFTETRCGTWEDRRACSAIRDRNVAQDFANQSAPRAFTSSGYVQMRGRDRFCADEVGKHDESGIQTPR